MTEEAPDVPEGNREVIRIYMDMDCKKITGIAKIRKFSLTEAYDVLQRAVTIYKNEFIDKPQSKET